ncbi:MAG: hypothetical protein H6741_29175 [Alphaproteobacteria bacterium]|nr:hypothetical protein [Alphaproteobacteria bacterium]MCB9796792.1 hypothetical protein [Alphaproteobacteria bacterium]
MTPLLLLLACYQIPEFVTLSGEVYADRFEGSDPVPGAELRYRDATTELVETLTTDADGAFSFQASAGQAFYITLGAEGFVDTAFAGTLGIADAAFDPGMLWMESEEDVAELEGLFAGCPELASADPLGGLIEGEIRFYAPGYTPDEGSEWPPADTAWVKAYDVDGVSVDACFLDEAGSAYDPEAAYTGPTGRFAIFDAPTGPVTLEVGYDVDEQPYYTAYYYIWVPESGVVPFWPLYVNLPGT